MDFFIYNFNYFYGITYWDINYSLKKTESNTLFYDYISSEHFLITKKFNYFYHREKMENTKNLIINKTIIKQINLLGKEKIIYEQNEPIILKEENIFLELFPILTKKIIVVTSITTDVERLLIKREFYPTFEFGIYEFWYYPFPILWKVMDKIPLVKIG